jgi:hypothetical protein
MVLEQVHSTAHDPETPLTSSGSELSRVVLRGYSPILYCNLPSGILCYTVSEMELKVR